MLMKHTKCKKFLTAKILVTTSNDKTYDITLFTDTIIKLTKHFPNDGNIKQHLLCTDRICFNLNGANVANSVILL